MKIVKFYTPGCGPCKAMTPILEKASSELNIPLESVDITNTPDLVAKYGIRGVPTTILLGDNYEVLAKFVGLKPNIAKEIESYV
jgi:thiol-disulfide isomerase/thioredoxin